MGNSICSCNNKEEAIESQLYQNQTPYQNLVKEMNNKSDKPYKARRGHSVEDAAESFGTVYNFMILLKFQRIIRKLYKFNSKTKSNKEGYNLNLNNGNENEKSFSKDPLKKTGFDDKNCTYYGEHDESGNKHGFGLQKWKDGAVYKGNFIETVSKTECKLTMEQLIFFAAKAKA